MYDFIFSDLDGTLLRSDHNVSDYTLKVLQQLHQQGKQIVLATGRHYVDVKGIRSRIGLPLPLITANGARVHDANDNCLFSHNIDPTVVAQLLALPRPASARVNMYRDDQWIVTQSSPDLEAFHQDSGFLSTLIAEEQLPHDGVSKLFFIGEHQELVAFEHQIQQQLGPKVSVAFSLPECLEVMAHGVSKGEAIRALLAQHQADVTQAIAFGDGMNDFEMLSTVARGVLMANASPRLRELLPDYPLAQSSDNDGVARYLAELYQL